jgi:hypothetical protein
MDPETPTERAALLVWLLAQGYPLSTQELARHLNTSTRGTRWVIEQVSRAVPVETDGFRWWMPSPKKRKRDDGRIQKTPGCNPVARG